MSFEFIRLNVKIVENHEKLATVVAQISANQKALWEWTEKQQTGTVREKTFSLRKKLIALRAEEKQLRANEEKLLAKEERLKLEKKG